MDRTDERNTPAMIVRTGVWRFLHSGAIVLGAISSFGFSPPEPMSAPTALRLAITELTREAEQAEAAGDVARRHADFAARFPHGAAINLSALRRKLAAPVHHQPFVDAYVRWQLTSLVPVSSPAPELTAREFERLLEQFPPVHDNPRADEAMIVRLRDASEAGPLTEAEQSRFEQIMSELAQRAGRAEALARPALDLRMWWENQYAADRARRLHLLLERCAALTRAGWSVEEIKATLDDAFASAAHDREVDDDERAAIAARSAKLPRHRRMFIESAPVVDGTLILTLREAAVYEFDATRWTRELRRDQ